MRVTVQGACQAPKNNETYNTRLSVSHIKFPTAAHNCTRSTKNKNIHNLLDHAKNIFVLKGVVSEHDLQPLCGRFRADSVRALRRFRQTYSAYVDLVIVAGVWTAVPVGRT
jgi:hypothetical protein